MNLEKLDLEYTLLCDDVRLEFGGKISLMGVFQNVMVEQLPVSIIKFAVINHWRGEGVFSTEVRILSPDKMNVLVSSQISQVDLSRGGFTDNVSFFVNVVFPEPGAFWVQTFAESQLLNEFPLMVSEERIEGMMDSATEISEKIN